MDCKSNPSKCLIEDQYCPEKVAESYDSYCNKTIDCKTNPNKCDNYFSEDQCSDKQCLGNQVLNEVTQ